MMWHIIAILILFAFSAFFSSSETAFTSLTAIQSEELATKHGRRGALVKRLHAKPDLLITTILIGNNLVNIAATAIATEFTTEVFGNQALGIMTGIMTLAVLIFAEVTPKRLAIVYNEVMCLATAPIILALTYVFRPFVWVIDLVSSVITRFFPATHNRKVSLEGILHMVSMAELQGVVGREEKKMLKSALRLRDISIQAVMTHRTRVFSLDARMTVEEAYTELRTEGFSRIPVYKDDPEEIVGIVFTRDVMDCLARGERSVQLKTLMSAPFYVSENRTIDDLFQAFRRRQFNMAVVLDEYGGLSGIVTREDVVEEIVGDLYDENESPEEEKISHVDESTFRMAGDTLLHDAEDYIGENLPHDRDVQTIGGYLIESLGRLPEPGDVHSIPGAEFTIESVKNNRVLSLLYRKVEETE